ncbi:hypothetical protein V5N11_017010 [Cardamine amara subsp. amara]|uniref:Retrotransposon Copia-like N-terminal domain-containing protein n=1 Tax=Cardamine amara subsp. amara TaxID=228776 RepID=A0ABD1BFK9_CARAN
MAILSKEEDNYFIWKNDFLAFLRSKNKIGFIDGTIKKRVKEAREKEQRYAFLMGLNKGLSYVRTQTMLMNPPPSLNRAYALVNQAESMMISIMR